jgi:hypothetical protein
MLAAALYRNTRLADHDTSSSTSQSTFFILCFARHDEIVGRVTQ